jgi:four helix bundle protein
MAASSFRDLRVWQEAMKLTTEIYRRAAVSVPSNIAEGKGHRSDREFVRFLLHARGSLLEVQTQLLIAEELQYFRKEEGLRRLALTEGVGRALSGLINSMSEKAA